MLHGKMPATTLELKEQTKQSHQLLEAKMVRSIKAICTVEEYGELLRLFYSFFAPLEQEVIKYLNKPNLSMMSGRRKALLLRTDILHHHGELPALAKKNNLPQIKDNLQALGALYVMEGSTLGGAMIIKMIATHLNMDTVPGTLFFEGYKEDTQMMWSGFKEMLDEQVVSHEEQLVVTAAANQTFECFSIWFETHKRAVISL